MNEEIITGIQPLYHWFGDTRAVHEEFLEEVVKPQVVGGNSVPKTIVVPSKYLKALADGGEELLGFTERFSVRRGRHVSTVSIAFVPRNVRTSVRLHELGHIQHSQETRQAGRPSETLKVFIRDELAAEIWGLSKKGRVPTVAMVKHIALRALAGYGNSPKTITGEMRKQLGKLGYDFNRELREGLEKFLEEQR